jgi:hypothetical protein
MNQFEDYLLLIKNAEAMPSRKVWMGVEKHLQKKKKRGVFAWSYYTQAQKWVLFSGLLTSLLSSIFLYQNYSKNNLNVILPNVASNNKTQFYKKVTFDTDKNQNNKLISKINEIKIVEKNYRKSIDRPVLNLKNKTNNDKLVNASKLISQIPIIESEDQKIKVYYNQNWIELEPVEIINKRLEINEKDFSNEIMAPITLNQDYKIDLEVSKSSNSFYFTPVIGGNLSQVFYNSNVQNDYFSSNAVFTSKFGYTTGFQLGYYFKKHWSVETGAYFSQYIQGFKEGMGVLERDGLMYIDQLEFPLMLRYSIFFDNAYPKVLSLKAGLIYGSVLQYQVNYYERNLMTNLKSEYNIDADKRQYNSLQMGYIAGFDFDNYLSKRFSLNTSIMASYVSQLENFPLFNSQYQRPRQLSTFFSIGIKVKF